MIDERINDHLQSLQSYQLELKKIKGKKKDEFLNDNILIAATERYFQLAIESCINIANRILSIEQFNKPIKAPETYSEIFEALGNIGIVEKDFAINLQNMARFRNRLVHLYWEIDKQELYNYLQNNLKDFEQFVKSIIKYLS